MDRIERIAGMERALDKSAAAVRALQKALDRYRRALPELRELEAYYQSSSWLEDLDADRAGELPADLRRGVLSEDAVWDLLENNARVLEDLRAISEETSLNTGP